MMNDNTINDLDDISDLDNPSSPDAGVDYANEHERLYALGEPQEKESDPGSKKFCSSNFL
jgi:hypothetical protein